MRYSDDTDYPACDYRIMRLLRQTVPCVFLQQYKYVYNVNVYPYIAFIVV